MTGENHSRHRKTIQLALQCLEFAVWIRTLLERDLQHRVLLVDEPDLRLSGIVVLDEEGLKRLSPILDPERFVVVVGRTTDITPIWEAGIRQVIFDGSSPESAHLTILAAELKMRTPPPSSKEIRP